MSFQRTSEIAGGGLAYNPGSTYFPLTDYMSKSGFTHAANVHTVFGIIQADPFVTATQTYRSVFRSVHSGNTIGSLNLQPTDAATAPAGGQMFGRDSAGGVMFDIRCSDVLVDGNKHWFFFAYNAATADYIFIVDGKNATIASETANTGTQSSGASAAIGLGSNDVGSTTVDYQGEISFFGYDDSYRENWYDFFESDGTPKEIDTAGWTEWGAQPLIFSPHADLRNNLGSLTAFAINGTGMRAGDMMNNAPPYRGLGTIGDATEFEIDSGKVAWVNAQRIRGRRTFPEVVDTWYNFLTDPTSNSFVMTVPTHQEGDLLVAVLLKRDGGGTITTPAGWIFVGEYLDLNLYQQLRVYTRPATASEPATYTFNASGTDRMGGMMSAIRNTAGIDGTIQTYTGNGGSDLTVPFTRSTDWPTLHLVVGSWVFTVASNPNDVVGDQIIKYVDSPQQHARINAAFTNGYGDVVIESGTATGGTNPTKGAIKIKFLMND